MGKGSVLGRLAASVALAPRCGLCKFRGGVTDDVGGDEDLTFVIAGGGVAIANVYEGENKLFAGASGAARVLIHRRTVKLQCQTTVSCPA